MKVTSEIDYKRAIAESGKSIFDPIEVGDPNLWIPTFQIETLLNSSLCGRSLAGLALRTRSKVLKELVCEALGYPVPKSFKRVQPRFFGQQLDVYAQKATNLQIWNEDLSPTRRYAIVEVLSNDVVGRVRVVNGQQLAILDRTGTITTKYQAYLDLGTERRELVSREDTVLMQSHIRPGVFFPVDAGPSSEPRSGELLPIREIFSRLSALVGSAFPDPGIDQERNRGAALHDLVCKTLGYSKFGDTGQFPDVRHQLLEIKLQTSPTIDLGLVEPVSRALLDVQKLGGDHPRHCDARYAIFYAATDGKMVVLTHLFMTTGEMFFSRFRKFGGKVVNGKLQISLSRDFFS